MKPPTLASDEVLLWKGRQGYAFRYPLAALSSFIGLFFILLGPIGEIIGVISFFTLLISIIATILSIFTYRRSHYYITSRRIITSKTSVPLEDLANVRVEQTTRDRMSSRGQVFFDSRDGRWAVFRRVKEPGQIKESVLNAKATLPASPPPTLQCGYCGKRAPLGTVKCPYCGADL